MPSGTQWPLPVPRCPRLPQTRAGMLSLCVPQPAGLGTQQAEVGCLGPSSPPAVAGRMWPGVGGSGGGLAHGGGLCREVVACTWSSPGPAPGSLLSGPQLSRLSTETTLPGRPSSGGSADCGYDPVQRAWHVCGGVWGGRFTAQVPGEGRAWTGSWEGAVTPNPRPVGHRGLAAGLGLGVRG